MLCSGVSPSLSATVCSRSDTVSRSCSSAGLNGFCSWARTKLPVARNSAAKVNPVTCCFRRFMMRSPKKRFGNSSVGETQPQADVEQPLPAGCRTLHSTEALRVISMVAGAHRLRREDCPLQPGLPRNPAATGREQYPTLPGPAIGPSFGCCPFATTARCDGSSHDVRPPADPLGQTWMIGWATAQISGLAYIL